MIPDSMTDGRKTIIAAIVCFACVFIDSPKRHPTARVTQSSAASAQKYSGTFSGNSAPKARGAAAKTIRQAISVWTNEERNCVITPR